MAPGGPWPPRPLAGPWARDPTGVSAPRDEMSRERRHPPIERVKAVAERAETVTQPPREVLQRVARVDGNVTVARRDVPPAHAELVDVRRLEERREQHDPV